MIELHSQQAAAVPLFVDWHRRLTAGDRSVPPGFVVFGEAGTGKTTLARALIDAAELTDEEVGGGAMQASAAANLQRISGWHSQTLHRWNYRFSARIGGPIAFQLNPDSDVRRLKLLVVDEISQVNLELWRDTICHGAPVLVLGDPGQLPPVEGRSIADHLRPDVILTEIQRQELSNPIVYWSRMVREGWDIPMGEHFDPVSGQVKLRKLPLAELTDADFTDADAILVWRNATRHRINLQQRRRLGFSGPLPQVGERIVCHRNQYEHGLVNAFGGTVMKAGRDKTRHSYVMTFRLDETAMVVPERVCRKETLGIPTGPCPEFLSRSMSDIAYGYAHTVHAFIGRQANKVVLIDEHPMREGRNRWLYTALTRAAEQITIAVP